MSAEERPTTKASAALLDWFVVAARLTRDGLHGRELQRLLVAVEREAAGVSVPTEPGAPDRERWSRAVQARLTIRLIAEATDRTYTATEVAELVAAILAEVAS